MGETNTNSHAGFKYGIIALCLSLSLFLGVFLLEYFTNGSIPYSLSMIIGLVVFVVGILSIIGLIKSTKGIREPNTTKKIIGIILNAGFTILFVSVFVANINDMFRVF